MMHPSFNSPSRRHNPFSRSSPSPSPAPPDAAPRVSGRPKSVTFTSPVQTYASGHVRNGSLTPLNPTPINGINRQRSNSARHTSESSNTFAPKFIKSEELRRGADQIRGEEGDNDFSGKRYVWLKDPERAFIRGAVLRETEGGLLVVQCDDGRQVEVDPEGVDKVNPPKFDKADDMAELTHLNEGSVIHNLHTRYQADLIYTYSGLFLVTVNPYCPLPIYSNEYVKMYKGQSREDTRPHIFAMADEAFRNLVEEGENQSILVTGESGAGKTENTKKVIQYLAAVAPGDAQGKPSSEQLGDLSQQILRANPILEAFGNAQTVRNNNSSRFGKFIRIEFSRTGQICGAFIDWYLLEKSRVVKLNSQERSYHIFYQLLHGASKELREQLHLSNLDIQDFAYTKDGNDTIAGVSDEDEWDTLVEAFDTMKFEEEDQLAILRTIAAVLHLGNITVGKESLRADQAKLTQDDTESVMHACHLLGIPLEPFVKGLLHPRVKAGREWVEKVQTPEQVRFAIDSLAKGIYERGFGDLVNRINHQLDRSRISCEETYFIGVLDIAGFEIFGTNSFEQLCINYTNEKLQQFFNHHMFVLEQEEYSREQIEWQFIDFGKDLQPTIDLIELSNPIGIFSCLDEDSVMPKATDKTFTEKLHSLWDRKSPKYRASRLSQGFILTHYAAEVEYNTENWLEKNKDPLNDNVTRLLSKSNDPHIANLFADYAEDVSNGTRSVVKKGLFRTVAQRHKEQLSSLMAQLHSTHPHFVRCILPNNKKRPKLFNGPLVLDQLRCNGVLEGIRIARTGFPNRLTFNEFRQRYEVLCRGMPKGYLDGQMAVTYMVDKLGLDKSLFRIGLTKIFFRAGVLAELEEQRDTLIREIMRQFQSLARGFIQRHIANKRLYRTEATRIIQRNFHLYLNLKSSPWWRLFATMKPLLGETRTAGEVKKRDEKIQQLEAKAQQDIAERQRIEDERRKIETEMQRIRKTLESERSLALDKEEIFKRLQLREVELSEKLAGAIADQESLEDQLDELIAAKKKIEHELDLRRGQLEQAAQIMERLEGEKKELQERISDMEKQLKSVESTHGEYDEKIGALNQEINTLNSHLAMKDKKLQDLEAKLLSSDQQLDLELANTTKELEGSKKQIKQLLEENREIQRQIADLSSTSTGYEELVRRKEGEVAILKADLKKHEFEKRSLETEKRGLSDRHDDMQRRIRDLQAEIDTTKLEKANFEREALDARKLLEEKLSEDAESAQGRKMLDKQVQDLKTQLYQTQAELSRVQQSRDDVQMLSEHKFAQLKEEFDILNEAKITIEKEMYIQQDTLRRAKEARAAAEESRKQLQGEVIKLRDRITKIEESRLNAENTFANKMTAQATERLAKLQAELNEKSKALNDAEAGHARLSSQVQNLSNLIAKSENFRTENDQHKERLERELVTVKGRLAASENDNRALLNKVQQKNLDIARSNSRAGDTQRARLAQLQTEKSRLEESNKQLTRQLGDAQLSITSLEKQKEKLALSAEDLNHEVAREHKASRNAEKTAATAQLQLAEANRNLETERQLRTQAQANTKKLQASMDRMNSELEDCHQQLILLHKVFDPNDTSPTEKSWETIKPDLSKKVDMAALLETAHNDLRISEEKRSRAENQLNEMRRRHADEMNELDARYSSSKRALLEEIDQNQVANTRSPGHFRKNSEPNKRFSNPSTPNRRYNNFIDGVGDSGRSDRTVDTVTFQKRMDQAAEIESLQNQLQLAEMHNRHLQSQVDRATPARDMWQDESPSIRRMQILERENGRLHEKLDDSAKKVSALEKSIQSGELSLRDVQAKSHEELYDLLSSQEQSRRSLLQVHKSALADLTHAKTEFEKLKHARAAMEVELRDTRSELQELQLAREHDNASRSQLLQEFSDLQIRLDAETSKAIDADSSLSLYKSRANEYFSKLEQAEIAVLKATRAEQFAKAQAKEAEETCANIMAERKQTDNLIEDLQRQAQSHEERIEDLSADLEAASQAKKRLQHELEDYRSQRAMDIEDKEASMEQTRKKYQMECSTLTSELEIERENVLHIRGENARLKEELEELRSKWDDEVLNSSTWSKEKSRIEMTLQDITASRDDAVKAHNEAQSKVVTLLNQVRTLRTSVDDISAERDMLLKEKRGLESRLAEAGDRLEDLAKGESPMRNAAGMDREILELKSQLAQQEDLASAAVGKMRRAEALATEVQKEIVAQRESTAQLFKDKAALEKQFKEVQLRCVDLETKGYSSSSQDVRFLNKRIQELETQLEEQESKRNAEQRSVRNVDRTVKDLQTQIERREKVNSQLTEDIGKSRDRIERLLQTIEELQTSDSENQLQARRAERELREEREKSLRLERELEGWKSLRLERGSMKGPGYGGVSEMGDRYSRRGSGVYVGSGIELPQRKLSNSKGFL